MLYSLCSLRSLFIYFYPIHIALHKLHLMKVYLNTNIMLFAPIKKSTVNSILLSEPIKLLSILLITFSNSS